MKTAAQSNTAPKPAPERHRLRDDPQFQAHYNAILSGLFSRFECEDHGLGCEDPMQGLKEMSERCENLVAIGYRAACHAHAYTQIIEPFTDEELAAFNAAVDAGTNGDK
jgi:hypothetical protein